MPSVREQGQAAESRQTDPEFVTLRGILGLHSVRVKAHSQAPSLSASARLHCGRPRGSRPFRSERRFLLRQRILLWTGR